MDKSQNRRDYGVRLAATAPAEDDDLSWMPAWRIRELIGSRTLSPVEVTEHFLERIAKLQPELHAFRHVDADGARAQARTAEAAVMTGEPLGPLHGIPLATKEFLEVRGLAWHDNSVPRDIVAHRDSLEAERLRAAGAVMVGSTIAGLVVREFSGSDRMPLNPWDTNRVCGDSSSGSACAMAAAMVPLSVTGDGLGSTRIPAAFCGLVGLVATRGLIPGFEWELLGATPISSHGPMARDVRDAAITLSVLAGPDGRSLVGLPFDPPDFLANLDGGARGMQLVWSDDFGYAQSFAVEETPRVIQTVRSAAFQLAEVGAEVRPTNEVFENPAWAAFKVLMSDPTIAARMDPAREDVVRIYEIRQRIWTALRRVLSDADFILTPTSLSIAPTRQDWARRGIAPDFSGLYSTMTGVANLLGWPAISVPAGLVDGMPVGLQILGRPGSESRMLQLAQAFLSQQGGSPSGSAT